MVRFQALQRKHSARTTRRPRTRLDLETLESRIVPSANDFAYDQFGINQALLGNNTPTAIQVNGQTRYIVAGEWFAKFSSLSGNTQAAQLASAQALLQPMASGLQVIQSAGVNGLVVLQTDPNVPQAAMDATLATVSGFQYVEPYYVDYGPMKSLFWTDGNDIVQQNGAGGAGGSAGPSGSPGPSDPGPQSGPGTSVNIIKGFDGINFGQSGGWTPPDTDGAVGPSSFVQNVNSSIAIYSKTTGAALAGPTAVATFWAPENENGAFFSDPVAVYDEFAQKFVVVEGNFSNNNVFVAVSKTSNPTLSTSDWNYFKYVVNDGTGTGMDYPKIGYNKDGYVLSYNMFSSFYSHSTVLSIRKSDMTGFVNVVPGGFNHFTLAPATMHTSNAGDPMWFVEDGHEGGGGSTVNVVKMANPYSSSPTFTTTSINVNSYGDAPNPRQPGAFDLGNRTSLGTRFFFSGLRQVGNQTLLVSADAVGANSGSQVRWYEFDVAPSTPQLVQQGAINQGTGVDTFYPDVDIAAGGTLGITFDQSSATAPSGYLATYVTGRNVSDPAGTMQTPVVAKQGIGTLTAGGRGGDYSFTSIDPSDGSFWATNEYAPTPAGGGNWNWATWITHFTVAPPAGPSVVSQTPSGSSFGTISSVRVGFDESIQPSSFDTTKIDSFTGPHGAITVTAVTAVSGSNNTQFDLSFAAQSSLGNYTLVLGPNILDTAGHQMDQNHNGTPGESGIAPAGDEYQGTFTLQGLKVVASTPSGNSLPGTVSDVTLTFNEAVNPSTFTTGQVAFTGPGGPVSINSITALDNTNALWDINFNAPTTTGVYKMTIGPNIQDNFGNAMDQNGNFIPGETTDTYSLQFGITGPKITAVTPTGSFLPGQVSTMRLTFDRPMNTPGTGDVSITDPTGAAVTINSVTPVNASNNTQFDVAFNPAGITGVYLASIGPNCQDTFGNAMDQNGNLITGETPGDQFNTRFTVLGPRVNSSQALPSGSGSTGYESSVRFFFNERMDPTTFTASQVKFTGPGGAISVGLIAAVGGTNNTEYDVTFAPQTAIGIYHMTIGPNIDDYFGNAMDQNGNLIPGEATDTYTATFTIAGPRIVASTPTGNANLPGTVTDAVVTFNESMDPTTFTPSQVFSAPIYSLDDTSRELLFNNSQGSETEDNWVANSFQVTPGGEMLKSVTFMPGANFFNQAITVVIYTGSSLTNPHAGTGLTRVSTTTTTFSGTNGSLVTIPLSSPLTLPDGQVYWAALLMRSVPGSVFAFSEDTDIPAGRSWFDVGPTKGASYNLDNTTNATVLGGNQPVVGVAQAAGNLILRVNAVGQTGGVFAGPGGSLVAVNDVQPVPNTGDTQFDISFSALTTTGLYGMAIGPNVRDLNGNAMDQNGNFIPGETPGDQYTLTFGVAGPHIVSTSPRGAFTPVSTVHVVFSESIDPTTFNTAQILSFKDPTGKSVAVTGINSTTGDNSEFDITFAGQTTTGVYTMILGSGIQDIYGNPMDQNGNLIPGETGDRYTLTFKAFNPIVGPDAFGYTGDGTYAYEDHDIAGLSGTFTIIQSSGGFFSPTAAVNLGTNSLNFYGQTYTGNNHLYVSGKGIVSFGSGVSYGYYNTTLTTDPSQAAIAPLWDDWTSTSGNPMVIGRFEDTTGSGTPDRLVIEWNQVQRYFNPSETPITFQLIIGLNGNPTDTSPITFNYESMDTGDTYAFGGNAAVGIKAAGNQGANRLLVSYHDAGISPFLQTHQAVQFTAPNFGGTIQGNVYQDNNNDGHLDPGDPGISGATVFLDVTGTGTFDPTNDPTAITDANGNYSFTGVVPGPYLVGVVAPDGSVQTQPPAAQTSTVEDFESGSLSKYAGSTSAWTTTSAAAHDGTLGLSTTSSAGEWIYRTDAAAHVQQGETISSWVQLKNAADGRAYFGFGASSNGTLSAVLAPNSNTFIIQQNAFYNFQDLASVSQTYQANHWYLVSVQWNVGGGIIARLYDSDGTTLLNTVTATSTLATSGGIAFRGFSSSSTGRIYFDTVTAQTFGEYPVTVGIRQTVTVGNFGFYFPPSSGAIGPNTASGAPASGSTAPTYPPSSSGAASGGGAGIGNYFANSPADGQSSDLLGIDLLFGDPLQPQQPPV